jgi:hypothetical protein
MKHTPILAAAVLLAACATVPVGGVGTPSGPSTIPSTPLDLGDWPNASEAATLRAFQQNVTNRYGAGLALSDIAADLRRADFTCGAASPENQGRGDPPAQVCRRTTTQSGCTHTWQVHLFDARGDGRLARSRGLYDRRCGNEGLLGGPG